jgi:FtsZ-interacting cell division protein ZipA
MAQILTIISGVVLLVVFVLVAWTVRRRRSHSTGDRAEQKD